MGADTDTSAYQCIAVGNGLRKDHDISAENGRVPSERHIYMRILGTAGRK